jgi:hypothetical protein
MMTPAAFKTGWETAHAVAPASAELQSAYSLSAFNAGGSLTRQGTNYRPALAAGAITWLLSSTDTNAEPGNPSSSLTDQCSGHDISPAVTGTSPPAGARSRRQARSLVANGAHLLAAQPTKPHSYRKRGGRSPLVTDLRVLTRIA